MYIRKRNVTEDLEALCASFETNQKNITRITNCLWRIKITTVEDFKNTSLDVIVERIKKRTGQRIGEKTMSTLIKMHG